MTVPGATGFMNKAGASPYIKGSLETSNRRQAAEACINASVRQCVSAIGQAVKCSPVYSSDQPILAHTHADTLRFGAIITHLILLSYQIIMTLRIIATGGTFDKHYNELNGVLGFADSHLPEVIKRTRMTIPVELEVVSLLRSEERR